jgi:hypothetical protein
MTTDELDFKRIQVGVMALLTINVGCLLAILDAGASDWPLWIAVLFLALALPSLALAAYFILVFGQRALEFSRFELVAILGQLFGWAVLACVFFHFSWIAGIIFFLGCLIARDFEMRDCSKNGIENEAADHKRRKNESEAGAMNPDA